jgi:spore coat protein CotF
MRSWAAHEFLETTELLRKLTADIELHALFAGMTTDQDLKNMLQRHIQAMDSTYHQAINLLQNKGVDISATNTYQTHAGQHPHVGFQNQQTIPAPSTNATRLSDFTIGTAILNSHKAGAMFGMLWANECVDPDIRSLHVMSANNCQQMAYETFQLLNMRGFYEVPNMPVNSVRTMTQAFQPMANMNAGYGTAHQYS